MFAKVPIEVFKDTRLSKTDLRVLGVILGHSRNDKSFPSTETIATILSVDRSKVSTATKRLVEFGWLSKSRKGFQGVNTYIFNSSYVTEVATVTKSATVTKQVTSNVTEVVTMNLLNEPTKEPTINNIVQTPVEIKFASDSEALQTARHLARKVLDKFPHLSTSKTFPLVTPSRVLIDPDSEAAIELLQKWASTLDLMNRRDQREWSLIQQMIDYVSEPSCWFEVQSAQSLRDKQDRIIPKLNKKPPQTKSEATKNFFDKFRNGNESIKPPMKLLAGGNHASA